MSKETDDALISELFTQYRQMMFKIAWAFCTTNPTPRTLFRMLFMDNQQS